MLSEYKLYAFDGDRNGVYTLWDYMGQYAGIVSRDKVWEYFKYNRKEGRSTRSDSDVLLASLLERHNIIMVEKEPKDMISYAKRFWGLTTLEDRSKILEYLLFHSKHKDEL